MKHVKTCGEKIVHLAFTCKNLVTQSNSKIMTEKYIQDVTTLMQLKELCHKKSWKFIGSLQFENFFLVNFLLKNVL